MYFSGVNPIRMIREDFDMFWKFFPAATVRTAFAKITGKKLRMPIYCGHIVKTHEQGNELIKKYILSGTPFMFGRNGGNETFITGQGIMLERGITNDITYDIDLACAQCGLITHDNDSVIQFSKIIEDATAQCDIYGTFRWIWEDYLISHYAKKEVALTHANIMDFWRFKKPFSCCLKGKKVLVVSPFADQIQSQYKKREMIFEDPSWLPEFNLSTLKSVQTIAGIKDDRFSDWFEALEYMKSEVEKIDFDIALLGCGAYGMPLTAHIKKMGKQAIYMGGVLQMLFGIRGKRWDLIPEAKALYNEYWVSPQNSSIPKNADIVEGGCYW